MKQHKSLEEVCKAVTAMQRDNNAKSLAQREGLAIQSM